MNQESLIAAKWWADQLRNGVKHETDDPVLDSLHSRAALHAFQPTREQIEEFEKALSQIIQDVFVETDGWRRAVAQNNPNIASALRILQVDYGACDELRAASQMSGFPIKGVEVFPIKTCMWISPGSVKVSRGYGSKIVELMVS